MWQYDPIIPNSSTSIIRTRFSLIFIRIFFSQCFLYLGVPFSSIPHDCLFLHWSQHSCCLFTSHNRYLRTWPGKQKPPSISSTTHSIISSSETASEKKSDLWYCSSGYLLIIEIPTAFTILAPCFAIPSVSYLRPTMNPVIFWRNRIGTPLY